MRLKFVPDFSAITKKDFASTHLDNFHVIKPRFEPLQNAYRLQKRIFDIAVSSLVIVLFCHGSPLLAIIKKSKAKDQYCSS
jgi:putative colanic acid biosynthesis UDP-glucose lipid carrier transferase